MTIYLYKKTHNKTGLQYLGKTTSSDPHKYRGSGHIWKLHIKKHGYDVTTEILKECNSTAETKFWGEYYSNLWNVVESDGWANLKPESGDGGRVPDEVRDTKSWNTLAAISKRSGSNHYSKKTDYKCKTGGDNNPMRRPEVIAKRSGDNNPMRRPEIAAKTRDNTIYTFVNGSGEVVETTRYDFIQKYKVPESNLSKVISGTRKSVLGWRLVTGGRP